MKWIGQHIWDLISRFRSDVYLDSPTAGGSDPDKFLGIDADNKIIYRTGAEVFSDIGAAVGDITGVDITGGTNLTVASETGTTSGNYSCTLNVDDAFLVNDGSDTTTGTITAGGFTTTGTWTFDTSAGGTTGITQVNVGSTFTDDDVTIMSAGAIKEKIEAYGYSTTTGDITGVTLTTDDEGAVTDTAGSADFIIAGGEGIDTTSEDTTVTITAELASDSNKGVASFEADEFTVSSGVVNLKNAVTRVYGATTIKILPSDFLPNEDSLGNGLHWDDGASNIGIQISNNATEMWAFIDIPEGKKATHIDVYGSSANTLGVYECNVNASGIGIAKGVGAVNTQLDFTDVDSTATNFLGIYIATGNTTNRIYGGILTIADI
jgi:hypothetical protein